MIHCVHSGKFLRRVIAASMASIAFVYSPLGCSMNGRAFIWNLLPPLVNMFIQQVASILPPNYSGGFSAGKSGTDGKFHSPHDALNLSASCRSSFVGFAGRPPFCGASLRWVLSSKLLTNSSVPNGRPVCVHCRRAARSDSVSPVLRNARQLATNQCCRQLSMSRHVSASASPQWGIQRR